MNLRGSDVPGARRPAREDLNPFGVWGVLPKNYTVYVPKPAYG